MIRYIRKKLFWCWEKTGGAELPPSEATRRAPTPMLLCRLPTTAFCLDTPICWYLFPSTPLLLMWNKFCMSVHEAHEDRYGRKVCNLYHPSSNHLGLVPGWTVPCHTISFSSGTQHPNDGWPQLPSIQDKNVKWPCVEAMGRTKAPLVTVLLVPHHHMLRFQNLNSCWCISCFGRKTSEGASCLCLYAWPRKC